DRIMRRMLAEAAGSPSSDAADRSERDWKSYLAVRDEVIAAILEDNVPEAVSRDRQEGIAAFERVRQDLSGIQDGYRAISDAKLLATEKAANRSLLGLVIILCTTQVLAVGARNADDPRRRPERKTRRAVFARAQRRRRPRVRGPHLSLRDRNDCLLPRCHRTRRGRGGAEARQGIGRGRHPGQE